MPERANWVNCIELPSGALLLTLLDEEGERTGLAFIVPAEERENVAMHLLPKNTRIHYDGCDCLSCAPSLWEREDA